jgi:hypothetical protein
MVDYRRSKFIIDVDNQEPIPVSITGLNVSISGVTLNVDEIGGVDVLSSALPSGAAQEHVLANSPSSVRISDGTDFIEVVDLNNDKYLGTAIVQDVHISLENSSTTNLAAYETFIGSGISLLGINAIQFNLYTDQLCEISVQQSIDGVNWDIEDNHHNTIFEGCSQTIQATASWTRIVVTNLSAYATNVFRLQTALCPIAEPLPRSLGSKETKHSLAVNLASDHRIIDVQEHDQYGNIVQLETQHELLQNILLEMRKTRLLLEILVDEKIQEEDLSE